ncbi:hypothetical protein EF906_28220 [Streptomyces sp. WAC08241]|nr:hypothetical protein EF906_28220 [Streptomyces sp. WAC08241]
MVTAFGAPGTTTYVNGGTHHGPVFQGSRIQGDINVYVPQPPAPRPRPDQVPALTAAFVNRTADLSELDRWFGPPAPTAPGTPPRAAAPPVGIGVLHGLPGVGKTATAWHWAAGARERYPDGQLYVDFAALRGRSGGDVSEAVAMCLRGLGVVDAYLPDSLQERAALFRTRTADRRLLVVLDDVGDPAQVRPLVPKGPGSAVLVTSTSGLGELALDGARILALKPLDPDGALRLLAEHGGERIAADRDAAERLVDLCGGLPVALRIVAGRLATDPTLTAAALAAELADENSRLDALSLGGEHSMSAVLNPTYRLLPPGAARLYRHLGWYPCATHDVEAAAAALDATPAETAPLLRRLADDGLIERTADGRFRMHDLVRLHARERARAEEPPGAEAALVARVLTHHLVLTALADRAIREDRLRVADLGELLDGARDPFAAPAGSASAADPLAWLESRSADVLAVLRAGAARGGLDTPVWQLAEAYSVLFLHRRALGPWRESLELGAAAAAAAVAPAAEARLRSLLSRPLLDLAEDERARTELDTALACAEVAGDTVVSASVREFDGRYWDRHDPVRAVASYRASLELNVRAGEARGAAIATYFLGCAQDAAGEHTTALATLNDAHRMLTECRDPRMAARATAALGVAHDHLGDPEEAMRALEDAAATLRAERATHYEAQALVALADIAERTGLRRADAPAWLDRAAGIHEEGGSPLAPALRARLRAWGDE